MQDINILVGCERSGVVCTAFRNLGLNAWSCDIEDDYGGNEYHIKADVLDEAYSGKV